MIYLDGNKNICIKKPTWRDVAIVFVIIASSVLGFLFFSLLSLDAFEVAEMRRNPETHVSKLPARLVIPSIDLDAVVQYVGIDLNNAGEMAAPSNFADVGWYEHGVRPGMPGSAVIAGHLNGKNTSPAVFYDLDVLEIGDVVIVMSAKRIEHVFRVVRIETYDYNAPVAEIFVNTDGKAKLNLITFDGALLPVKDVYDKRTVVFTELAPDLELQ